jgi:hypothetical protein
MLSTLLINIQYHKKLKQIIVSPRNINYNKKGNTTYTVSVISPKETNHILNNIHCINSVISMSRTVGILLLMRY